MNISRWRALRAIRQLYLAHIYALENEQCGSFVKSRLYLSDDTWYYQQIFDPRSRP